jgi:hypothetical protein
MFGVLGDRLGGRALLCAMRVGYVLLAGVLLARRSQVSLTPSAVFIVAAIAGLVRPNDLVMRNALIGDTIPREHLMVALQDVTRDHGFRAGRGRALRREPIRLPSASAPRISS